MGWREYAWDTGPVIGTLMGAVAIGIGFVLWQWRGARYPLMPIYIYKSLLVDAALITHFINGWNSLVQIYYIPAFYQLAFGYSPLQSALFLLPLTLTQTVSSTTSGLIVYWTGRYRENIAIGWVIWAVGLGLYSTIDENTSVGKQVGYGVLTGFGVGQTLQP